MLKLKKFQIQAATQIAKRFGFFSTHPNRPSRGKSRARPFFQALSAITGAGKTPVLAQAVATMRGLVEGEPIVFWISKAKSVVSQTYANFTNGGKYSEILEGFNVIGVPQLTPELIADNQSPLLILATTGLFNQEDQEEGGLNIYKTGADKFGNRSAWERLIARDDSGQRRPMFVVYDEGHNFSEQQAKLLKQLEPDAYLVASATLKLPESFHKDVIGHINSWFDDVVEEAPGTLDEACFHSKSKQPQAELFNTTIVSSEAVVEAELIKRAIQFDGTTASMELSLDDLCRRMDDIETEISRRALGFKPKAIYVCNTNMVGGVADDHSKPFHLREAAPIRIWRYLVENKSIDPKKIAVYANLKFVDNNKPDEFILYQGKENDFEEFTAGNYQHIIFNQSLQEGWDDPACYLAYIDKSMGSSIQVEQVIGRVLRQYGAKHYENANLNSAHFFLRVDDENVFTEAIKQVKRKLADQGAPIEIFENFGGSSTSTESEPREDVKVDLCHVNVDAIDACTAIAQIVKDFIDFKEGDSNTTAEARSAQQHVDLAELQKELNEANWEIRGYTNPVRLRWLVNTALRARSNRALAVTNLQDTKFDVKVQMHSRAHTAAEELAQNIVKAYFTHSKLNYDTSSPFAFGKMRVPAKATTFKRGLYEQYFGFNDFEQKFVDGLDNTDGVIWHRNPSAGGFSVPLLTEGDTGAFYPDFIAWKDGRVYCLDTKGKHLLTDAIARKLFDVRDDDERLRIHVRLISMGKQTEVGAKAIGSGYTVWKAKQGTPTPVYVKNIADAVKECLKA